MTGRLKKGTAMLEEDVNHDESARLLSNKFLTQKKIKNNQIHNRPSQDKQ